MLAGTPYSSANALPQATAPAPPVVSNVPSMSKTSAATLAPSVMSVALGKGPAVRCDEPVDGLRTPGPGLVGLHLGRALEKRLRDLPQPLDGPRRREVRLVAEHGEVDQALVPLEADGLREGARIGEGERRRRDA